MGSILQTSKSIFSAQQLARTQCVFSASVSCCSGPWNYVVAAKGKEEKKTKPNKKTSALKQRHKFSLKAAVWGPVRLGSMPTSYQPRKGQAVGPLPLPALGFLLAQQCSKGPSAFPLPGWLGIDCFYEMNMTQKSIQHDPLVHLKESSAVLPITKCLSSCLLKHSLNQRTRQSSR